MKHIPPAKPEYMMIINATVITLMDNQFSDGYKAGYTEFHEIYANTPQSDLSLYQLLFAIVDIQFGGRRQAGYITGWMAAMFETFPGANANPQLIGVPNVGKGELRNISELMRQVRQITQ